MKVTITKNEHTGKTASNRKENNFTRGYTVVAYGGKEQPIKELIDARIYQTNSRSYACIWVHSHPVHLCGGGYAGGYGYHKPSAALQEAMHDAGLTLDTSISGVGDGAMKEALLAVAAALGFKKAHVVYSHP